MINIDLLTVRKDALLTQQNMADLADVSVRTYLDWEKGRVKPAQAAIQYIALMLDVHPDYVMVKRSKGLS